MGGQVAGVINGLLTALLVPTGQQVVRRLTVPVTVGVGPPLPSKPSSATWRRRGIWPTPKGSLA